MSVRTVGLDLAKQVFLSSGVEISTPIDSPLHVAVQDPLAWFHSTLEWAPGGGQGRASRLTPRPGFRKMKLMVKHRTHSAEFKRQGPGVPGW